LELGVEKAGDGGGHESSQRAAENDAETELRDIRTLKNEVI